MRFDIALKIVKFKNGQFGIRRWTIYGYRYLDLDIVRAISGDSDDYWWGAIKEHVATYAAGTEQQVRERLALYLTPKKKMPDMSAVPGFDKGTPA